MIPSRIMGEVWNDPNLPVLKRQASRNRSTLPALTWDRGLKRWLSKVRPYRGQSPLSVRMTAAPASCVIRQNSAAASRLRVNGVRSHIAHWYFIFYPSPSFLPSQE